MPDKKHRDGLGRIIPDEAFENECEVRDPLDSMSAEDLARFDAETEARAEKLRRRR